MWLNLRIMESAPASCNSRHGIDESGHVRGRRIDRSAMSTTGTSVMATAARQE
jgi:hypothetical protein